MGLIAKRGYANTIQTTPPWAITKGCNIQVAAAITVRAILGYDSVITVKFLCLNQHWASNFPAI